MNNSRNNSEVIADQKWTAYGVDIVVPGSFFVKVDTQLFIRLGGLFCAVDQLGGYSIKSDLIHDVYEDGNLDTKIVMKVIAKLVPNEKVIEYFGSEPDISIEAYGSATKQNLKSRVSIFPYEMADTRATARALRKLTHCAFTAIEELSGAPEGAGEGEKVEPGKFKTAAECLSRRDRLLAGIEKMMKRDPDTIGPRVQEYLDENGLNVIANCNDKQAEELFQRAQRAVKAKE